DRAIAASLNGAQAQLARDDAQLRSAQSDLNRYRQLSGSQLIARQMLDQQTASVQQLQATTQANQAAIDGARVQLSYTRIVSPIDGVAGIRGVDPGNVVTTSTNIVTITQVRPIYVSFTLPEQNLDLVRSAAGGAAALEVDALDRVDAHTVAQGGTLDVIDNTVDSATGTFKLRSVFVNEQGALWPGQFVNVRLKLR
ncbi:efflux RND transporter periplasmic adaptor subunit, partial [Lysobacter sp. 2RAB21]